MSIRNVTDEKLITETEMLKRIKNALANKKSFSLVRLGDLENLVLGQFKFFSRDKIIDFPLHRKCNKKKFTSKGKLYIKYPRKGIVLPNIGLRDKVIKGIRKADVVGVCRYNNDEINAPDKYKRELTNKIFDHYKIRPANLTYVFVSRKMVAYQQFWELVHRYRTLLISSFAEDFANLIKVKYATLKPNIVGCIDFTDHEQIPKTLEKLKKYHFDLALISAGVNAVIMAPEIACRYGKVALDFGRCMKFYVQSDPRIKPWQP